MTRFYAAIFDHTFFKLENIILFKFQANFFTNLSNWTTSLCQLGTKRIVIKNEEHCLPLVSNIFAIISSIIASSTECERSREKRKMERHLIQDFLLLLFAVFVCSSYLW